ncbi:MAG TPA: hypothetical protein VG367_20510 [Mucilaginibacter sp.]|jgi:hypothetical protein|nr:hypothetical protein [Mucilaginibacter sp.]
MGFYNLKYSAKVWLSSLLIGPPVATLAAYCLQGNWEPICLMLWLPPFICIVALFSSLTWVIFWGIINLVIRVVPEPFLQKFWIMLAGTALASATVCPFLIDNFSLDNDFLPLSIGYTFGIITGVWYCDLAKPVIQQEP